MNYKKLGNTDLNVSTICLGTMTWGEQNTQAEGFEQMDYALDQGVNFWDTAELYSVPPKEKTFGHTEIIIGNWLKKSSKRHNIILASKSKVRKEILDNHNVPCNVEESNVDEEPIKESLLKEGASPEIISKNLAELKANKVSNKMTNSLVLGADSVIDLTGELISDRKSVV